jgi:DNA-3-methyladenine glycosylase I
MLPFPFKTLLTMQTRCPWCGTDPTYVAYHDHEWGVPVVDDHTMFTFLLLETFQAGLSWITILKRKEGFARAFANFDAATIAGWGASKVEVLMQDPGIIRNRQKIEATLNNAARTLEVTREFGSFCDYWWQWVGYKPLQNNVLSIKDYQSSTALSNAISNDLKKRGFKFVGSTTIYAHLQAAGLVNDHIVDCFRYPEVAALGKAEIKKAIQTLKGKLLP